jgi:hypothetical protein
MTGMCHDQYIGFNMSGMHYGQNVGLSMTGMCKSQMLVSESPASVVHG